MADYGSVRHPLYSIGEGVYSERQERLRAQGKLKKKKKKEEKEIRPLPPPTRPVRDEMWQPKSMPEVDVVQKNTLNRINSQNVMDKIWGNAKQRKKKIM